MERWGQQIKCISVLKFNLSFIMSIIIINTIVSVMTIVITFFCVVLFPVDIEEGSDIGTDVASVTAQDIDSGDFGMVYYAIVSGNGDGLFTIHRQTGRCHHQDNCAPQSKNAVCTFQITCKLLSFYFGRFLKKLADDQCSSMSKGSI